MEVVEIVNCTLRNMGESPENIRDNVLQYLIQIESCIINQESQCEAAAKHLQNTTYDVKSIAALTGIARTTFYNYDKILQRYVDARKNELVESNPYEIIKKQQEIIRSQNNTIALMQSRDCKELILEQQISMLQNQLKEKDKTIDTLRKKLLHQK